MTELDKKKLAELEECDAETLEPEASEAPEVASAKPAPHPAPAPAPEDSGPKHARVGKGGAYFRYSGNGSGGGVLIMPSRPIDPKRGGGEKI